MKMSLMAVALVLGAAMAMPVRAEGASAEGKHGEGFKNNPAVQAVLADMKAIKAAHEAHDKAARKAAVEKLKVDFAALPPGIQKRVEEKHPHLAKFLEEGGKEKKAA